MKHPQRRHHQKPASGPSLESTGDFLSKGPRDVTSVLGTQGKPERPITHIALFLNWFDEATRRVAGGGK